MVRRGRRRLHLFGWGVLTLVSGCNAFLGIEDRPLKESVGTASGDGGTGPSGDGSTVPGADGGDASSISAYAAEVGRDVPLVYLRLGERTGSVAFDERSHLSGAYPAFGVTRGIPGAILGDPDTAISLDGTSRLTLPDGADFAGRAPFSVELWLKRSPSFTGDAFIIDHQTYSPRGGWLVLGGPQSIGVERYASDTENASLSAPLGAPLTDWHHVVAIWDGTREILLLDGRLVATGGVTSVAVPAIHGGFSIGGQNCACSGNAFEGAIDEVAIYDHVLTQERAVAHITAAGR